MIAEAGLAALWLAAALSLLQLLLTVGELRGWFEGARAIRGVAIVQGVATLVAAAFSCVFTFVPSSFAPATATSAMTAISRAYSAIVAPRSLRMKRRRVVSLVIVVVRYD
jgi:hypothetical protein